ncbi:HinfI family type II restriction enzyme [Mycoplasma seminis]|uniref:type II site-specific deoxyribonuclease n=1 Tax=Mycoplasma seminis TaxID=512749 RepID=A0ABY9HCG1_9MOLU|nr:restriction endonuclease [Mycoplasma seminis]WLP85889.1 restriction endonuclease [Mycoplasma seminis]
MDEKIKTYIKNKLMSNMEKAFSRKSMKKLFQKHSQKNHYISLHYRVAAGIVQSQSIQFGNFIEDLIKEMMNNDNSNFEILTEFSGKRKCEFKLIKSNDALIDEYITNRKIENELEDQKKFKNLIEKISHNIKSDTFRQDNIITTNDIDLLFYSNSDNKIYYVEIKYNDDHDSGKFIDINRKLLKTFAYLKQEFSDKDVEIVPILYYFNEGAKKSKNVYLPKENIMYGHEFFEKFLSIDYYSLAEYLNNLSRDNDIRDKFNELLNVVFEMTDDDIAHLLNE